MMQVSWRTRQNSSSTLSFYRRLDSRLHNWLEYPLILSNVLKWSFCLAWCICCVGYLFVFYMSTQERGGRFQLVIFALLGMVSADWITSWRSTQGCWHCRFYIVLRILGCILCWASHIYFNTPPGGKLMGVETTNNLDLRARNWHDCKLLVNKSAI